VWKEDWWTGIGTGCIRYMEKPDRERKPAGGKPDYQVRAISEVASAVTKGDLTRMIRVEAKGEVEELKDTINQMIANLKETTLT
jgi:hypothetical protein